MAKSVGMDGVSIIVETPGFPIAVADPKAAEKALNVVMKIVGINVNTAKLDKSVKLMEDSIRKTEELQKKIIENMKEDKNTNQYIG